MTDPIDKAWSATCRAILKVTAVPQSMGDKVETGIDWAVRMIKALDEKANRVPGLVLEIRRLNESAYRATFGGRGEELRDVKTVLKASQARREVLVVELAEANQRRRQDEERQENLEGACRHIDDLESDLHASRRQVEASDRQRGLAHDQIARLHREVREMEVANDGAQGDVDVLEEDTARANQRIDELKKERDHAVKTADTFKTAHRIIGEASGRIRKELAEVRQQLLAATTERAAFLSEMKRRQAKLEEKDEREKRLVDTGEGLADELRETQAELGVLDMRIVKAQSALAGK